MLSSWRSSISAAAAALPERGEGAAVDLAVGVLGDRVDDDDGGRHLEGHEGGAAVLEQRRLRRTQPWSDYDEAHRHFAVDLVAYANGRGVRHVGMLEQAVRELQRGDVDAALDDDVLLPSRDVDVAVGVAAGEVAVAEAVLRNRHQLLRAVPVRRGELPA